MLLGKRDLPELRLEVRLTAGPQPDTLAKGFVTNFPNATSIGCATKGGSGRLR
jgi:hypothetical protein